MTGNYSRHLCLAWQQQSLGHVGDQLLANLLLKAVIHLQHELLNTISVPEILIVWQKYRLPF